jgi:hypothetical protein
VQGSLPHWCEVRNIKFEVAFPGFFKKKLAPTFQIILKKDNGKGEIMVFGATGRLGWNMIV